MRLNCISRCGNIISKGVIGLYSLILVDDEKNILKNISSGIPWEDFGFSLKGSFTSANDALSYLEQTSVNCIISDIKMPEMDGLQFAEIVQKKYPDICFIILSAYQDFSYAQQALRFNVVDYIVKPVTYSKISDALNNVSGKINKSVPLFSRNYSNKHKLVSALVSGKLMDIDEIVDGFAKENIRIDPKTTPFALIKIQVENIEDFLENSWTYDISQFQNAFSYIAESNLPYIVETSSSYGNVTVLLIHENGAQENFLKFINETITHIGNNYFELLNCTVEFEILSIYANIKDLVNSSASENYIEIHIEELINAIFTGNISNAHNILDDKFSRYGNNVQSLRFFVRCLIAKISNITDINSIYSGFSINEISTYNCKEIMSLARKIVDKASVYFLTKSKNTSNLISIVKDYINKHYAENIMLSDLANLVYISESHFSRTFKQKTGESVVSYINKIRLTHARELLISSNLSIEDIYNSVGYKSRNLFFKNFKAVYGMTPNQYRMENSNDD